MVRDRLTALPLVDEDGERRIPREQDPLLRDVVVVADSRAEGPPSLEVERDKDSPGLPPTTPPSFLVRVISGILIGISSLDEAIRNDLPQFWGQPYERNYGSSSLQPASSPSPAQWSTLKIKARIAAVLLFGFLVFTLNNLLAEFFGGYHYGDLDGFSILASSLVPGLFAGALFFLWRSYTSRDYDRTQSIANLSIWVLGLSVVLIILYT